MRTRVNEPTPVCLDRFYSRYWWVFFQNHLLTQALPPKQSPTRDSLPRYPLEDQTPPVLRNFQLAVRRAGEQEVEGGEDPGEREGENLSSGSGMDGEAKEVR